jgi:serine/threonine protein kinase
MSEVTRGPGHDETVVTPIAVREPRIGGTVGSYRLVRLLGEGATGRVFEVEHLTIGRRAAMKILAPAHAARPGAVKRLFSEAKAVSKIDHPHILVVTDLIEADAPGGVNAIVMELLEGQSLAQAIAAAAPEGIPPARFLPILSQVAGALAAAHAASFIHRDLKPENIFLTVHRDQADYVKLLDFGLAKSMTDAAIDGAASADGSPSPSSPSSSPPPRGARWHPTAEGAFVGTPAYASPEQAAGKPLDHRTDIYALGVILYELLCKRLPFEGRNFADYVVKHITEPPPPTPVAVLRTPIGRALDAVARRCLAKDAADRYGSAAELGALFDEMIDGHVPDVGQGPPPTPWSRRASLLAAGVVAAGGLAIWSVRRATAPPRPPVAASPAAPAPARGELATGAAAGRGPRVVPLVPEKTVMLRFQSEPPGAQVRRVGQPALLGLTPFILEVPASGAAVAYELRLAGHAPRQERVTLTAEPAEQVVAARLRKLADSPVARRAPARTRAPEKPNRNGTLNPFER